MGCDIHMVVERRVGEEWIAVGLFDGFETGEGEGWARPVATWRNYERFARLAGVRGEGPPPRGIPDDLSQTARFLIADMGSDGHSHSWLSLREAAQIFIETQYTANKDFPEWAKEDPADFFFNVCKDEVDEHRLVFWFDN